MINEQLKSSDRYHHKGLVKQDFHNNMENQNQKDRGGCSHAEIVHSVSYICKFLLSWCRFTFEVEYFLFLPYKSIRAYRNNHCSSLSRNDASLRKEEGIRVVMEVCCQENVFFDWTFPFILVKDGFINLH